MRYIVKVIRGDTETTTTCSILAEAMIDAVDYSEEPDVDYAVVYRLVVRGRSSHYEYVRTVSNGNINCPSTKRSRSPILVGKEEQDEVQR